MRKNMFLFAALARTRMHRIFDFGNGAAANNFLMGDSGGGALNLQIYSPCSSPPIVFPSSTACASTNLLCFIFPTPITYGSWRHVCIANQGTRWAIYDNGTLVGSLQTNCPLENVVLRSNYLGRSNWNVDRLLQGKLSQFQIYNRVLSATEVASLKLYNGILHIHTPVRIFFSTKGHNILCLRILCPCAVCFPCQELLTANPAGLGPLLCQVWMYLFERTRLHEAALPCYFCRYISVSALSTQFPLPLPLPSQNNRWTSGPSIHARALFS